MRKFILVSFSLFVVGSIAWSEVPVFMIGTNVMSFAFENTALTMTNRRRIALDMIGVRSSWTNSTLRFPDSLASNGVIVDIGIQREPFWDDEIEMPTEFKSVGGTNYIQVATVLSDAYLEAFAFLDSHPGLYDEATNLVAALNALHESQLMAVQAKQFVSYPGMTDDQYDAQGMEILSDIMCQDYHLPSVLSIAEKPAHSYGLKRAAIWLLLPASSRPAYSPVNIHDVMLAVWENGRWKIWPKE